MKVGSTIVMASAWRSTHTSARARSKIMAVGGEGHPHPSISVSAADPCGEIRPPSVGNLQSVPDGPQWHAVACGAPELTRNHLGYRHLRLQFFSAD